MSRATWKVFLADVTRSIMGLVIEVPSQSRCIKFGTSGSWDCGGHSLCHTHECFMDLRSQDRGVPVAREHMGRRLHEFECFQSNSESFDAMRGICKQPGSQDAPPRLKTSTCGDCNVGKAEGSEAVRRRASFGPRDYSWTFAAALSEHSNGGSPPTAHRGSTGAGKRRLHWRAAESESSCSQIQSFTSHWEACACITGEATDRPAGVPAGTVCSRRDWRQ